MWPLAGALSLRHHLRNQNTVISSFFHTLAFAALVVQSSQISMTFRLSHEQLSKVRQKVKTYYDTALIRLFTCIINVSIFSLTAAFTVTCDGDLARMMAIQLLASAVLSVHDIISKIHVYANTGAIAFHALYLILRLAA